MQWVFNCKVLRRLPPLWFLLLSALFGFFPFTPGQWIWNHSISLCTINKTGIAFQVLILMQNVFLYSFNRDLSGHWAKVAIKLLVCIKMEWMEPWLGGSVGRASFCALKGCWLDSSSEHIPGLKVSYLARVYRGGNQYNWSLSLFLRKK